jgi:hypothetical protein
LNISKFKVGITAATTPQRANKMPYLQGTGAPRQYPHTLIFLNFTFKFFRGFTET